MGWVVQGSLQSLAGIIRVSCLISSLNPDHLQPQDRRLLEETKHLPSRRRALLYAVNRLSRALEELTNSDEFQLVVGDGCGLYLPFGGTYILFDKILFMLIFLHS